MGFFTGRVTFSRFRVDGPSPRMFTQDHLDRLAENAIGRQRIAHSDGVEVGWFGTDHILDTQFEPAKNIINDMLFFGMRVDQDRMPSDLMRAYYAMDLKALASSNPSGKASARQKREAKESARDRLEHEAKDGRYRTRKPFEIVWDALSNEVLFGTTSVTQTERLQMLFEQTFGHKLEPVTAGNRAHQLADMRQRSRNVDDAQMSIFLPGVTPEEMAWNPDDRSRDFIGNEFLLWLWFFSDVEGDTVKLSDDSDATFMLARTLTLECPRGQTGHETISSEGPTRLPESRRAIQSGKLPRKAGLTLVRHDEQFEFTMQAETLGVSGAKMPPPKDDETEERAKLEGRATLLRNLVETNDLLFDAFGQSRFSQEWPAELARMQKWISREERQREAA